MSNNYSLYRSLLLGFIVIGTSSLPTSAAASGFYVGADIIQRTTDLDYAGGSETYRTNHARVKAGYEILKFLAVEAQLSSAAKDTDVDPFGDLFQLDTGNIIGVYAKPKTPFKKANVYGLVGFAQWDTTYRDVATGIKDSDPVTTFGVGVGGEFNITDNLRFNIEGMIQTGSASYKIFFANGPDLYSLSLAAGMSYRF